MFAAKTTFPVSALNSEGLVTETVLIPATLLLA
jgi:hypothetical protein